MAEKLSSPEKEPNIGSALTEAEKKTGETWREWAKNLPPDFVKTGWGYGVKGASAGVELTKNTTLTGISLFAGALGLALKMTGQMAEALGELAKNWDKAEKWPGILADKLVVEPVKEAYQYVTKKDKK